jgi:hypothetical protein
MYKDIIGTKFRRVPQLSKSYMNQKVTRHVRTGVTSDSLVGIIIGTKPGRNVLAVVLDAVR